MVAKVDTETCSGCGECVETCPLDSIELKDDVATVDDETCADCGECVEVCPVEAITVE